MSVYISSIIVTIIVSNINGNRSEQKLNSNVINQRNGNGNRSANN